LASVVCVQDQRLGAWENCGGHKSNFDCPPMICAVTFAAAALVGGWQGVRMVSRTQFTLSAALGLTVIAQSVAGQCEPMGWRAFGSGVTSTTGSAEVNAMTTWDDGSGEALYIGGKFTHVDGVEASNIAKWDGKTWTSLSASTDGDVHALHVWNDGNGDALYVGGAFASIGGVAANRIAKWDGAAFSALGLGIGRMRVDSHRILATLQA
jgi:hypothetical protein